LGIVLSGDGRQVDFDNVRLDVVSTPEPSVLVLMLTTLGGVVGLLFARLGGIIICKSLRRSRFVLALAFSLRAWQLFTFDRLAGDLTPAR